MTIYYSHQIDTLDTYLEQNLPAEFIEQYNYHNKNVRSRMKVVYGSSSNVFESVLDDFVRQNNLQVLKEIEAIGINIEKYVPTLFNNACSYNALDCVEHLTFRYGDIVKQQNILNSGLSDAARKGYLEVIEFLVKEGADINSNEGYAFKNAVDHNQLVVVKYFIGQNAKIQDDNYKVIRSLPISEKHFDIFQHVIEYGYKKEPLTYLKRKLVNSSASKNKRRNTFFTNDNEYHNFHEAMETVIDALLARKNIAFLDVILDKGGNDTLIKNSTDPTIVSWYTKRKDTIALEEKLQKQLNRKEQFPYFLFKNISSFIEHKIDSLKNTTHNNKYLESKDNQVVDEQSTREHSIGLTKQQRRKI